MSKITTSKINEFEPIRASKKSDIKEVGTAESGKTQSVTEQNSVGRDKLAFSQLATNAAKQLDRLKELPDVRQEKVDSFRKQILADDYNPSSEDIADAILKDES